MESKQFPKDFLWGAATSSHQVEGGNSRNDWWAWEEQGKVPEHSGDACKHYEKYEQDFDLLQQMGHNTHRFSIEWSRIEPEEGRFDPEAIAHYRKVIEALRRRNIEPMVTLHHFTNPMWLVRQGGWARPQVVHHFERYTHWVVKHLGDLVKYWVTINEPLVYIHFGYIEGTWPPGQKSPEDGLKALRYFLEAHVRATEVIRGTYAKQTTWPKPLVGFAHHLAAHTPSPAWNPLSHLAVKMRDHFFWDIPFNALKEGRFKVPGQKLVRMNSTDTLDFLGINYYMREFIEFDGLAFPGVMGKICSLTKHRDAGFRNFLGWEEYPEGLYQILMKLRKYNTPILVTENGTCVVKDEDRQRSLKGHLDAVWRAIQGGSPVKGYYHWSLMDNFEWAEGYKPTFGLIEVDFKTQDRKVRPSGLDYAEICRTNALKI